ncbi:MAG: SRPBCC family protein [Novosphingobium sp.]|nr:SRPBCC family protein [Novosphingobium sp.]
MGIVTMVAEAAFSQSAEQVYDFVSNPANWVKTYPGSEDEAGLPKDMPLKVGDTWVETGPRDERYAWQVTEAVRPSLWACSTLGRIGYEADGSGGHEARIAIEYRFLRPGPGITIFQRTYVTETYKGSVIPDIFLTSMNPVHAETYFAGIARELEAGNSDHPAR